MRRIPLIITAVIALVAATLALCAFLTPNKAPQIPNYVIDLTNWKLTLPTDTNDEGEPDEIKQPALRHYTSEFFFLNSTKNGLVLRAMAGGATTSDSDFARTELREMTSGGTAKAAWSSQTGLHAITIRQAITALPPTRPSIVAGQIHDSDRYLVLIRLDGRQLYVKANGENKGDLDTNYQLGTTFTLKLEASNDRIRVYYNNVLKVELEQPCRACYFKAGAYLQSNTQWGDQPDAFGEVTIYDLRVHHSQGAAGRTS